MVGSLSLEGSREGCLNESAFYGAMFPALFTTTFGMTTVVEYTDERHEAEMAGCQNDHVRSCQMYLYQGMATGLDL